MYFKTKMIHDNTSLNIMVPKRNEKYISSKLESNKGPLVFKGLFINKELVKSIRKCVKYGKNVSTSKPGKIYHDKFNYNLTGCRILSIRSEATNNIRKSYSVTVSYKKVLKNK